MEDARAEAAAIIHIAKQQAAERIKHTKEQIRLNEIMRLEQAQTELVREQEQLDQARRNELKKMILDSKQRILDSVFESAGEDLAKLSETDNKKLCNVLAKRYSKKGDKVIPTTGVGIVINNPKYEIRLTLNELMEHLRDDIECDLVKMLFAEDAGA